VNVLFLPAKVSFPVSTPLAPVASFGTGTTCLLSKAALITYVVDYWPAAAAPLVAMWHAATDIDPTSAAMHLTETCLVNTDPFHDSDWAGGRRFLGDARFNLILLN
jgi:hypothetical protein